MDDSTLQGLVTVLQADHALHMCGGRLLCGQTERDWSLRELLATLGREVSDDFPLRERSRIKG